MELLKAGAETGKKDVDGFLALELAPDKEVLAPSYRPLFLDSLANLNIRFGNTSSRWQSGRVSSYEHEGWGKITTETIRMENHRGRAARHLY